MTAKEKAKDLVDKLNIPIETLSEGYTSRYSDASKQCALICVDEILESHYKVLVGVIPKVYDYWGEVKQEINKL
jgi:hypothetical protein